MKKYKAIAIPVMFTGSKPKFLTVRDRRFKDWIFVTGGCRRKEIPNPIRCALRELDEETRGVVNLKKGEYTDFKFVVKESPGVDLEYNVFIFFVNYTQQEQNDLVKKFNDEKQKTNSQITDPVHGARRRGNIHIILLRRNTIKLHLQIQIKI